MAYYTRTKSAIDTLKKFASKIVPNASIKESSSKPFSKFTVLSSKFYSTGYYSRGLSPIPRSSNSGFGAKRFDEYPLLAVSKRHYYVDRHRVYHFRSRGPKGWFKDPRNALIVFVVGSGVLITVYYGNLETVPYSKRKHFVLLSKSMEKRIGESQFEELKTAFKGKILPAIHPESVRVRLIAKDIIEALQRGLSQETVWTDLGYATEESSLGHERGAHDMLKALSEKEDIEKVEGNWHREDEILDDKWVQQSRKKGEEKGVQPEISHLKGLNWEVLVVNEPVVNAFCLPGGKIVVFTGLLEHFRSDAEVATVLGHEVHSLKHLNYV